MISQTKKRAFLFLREFKTSTILLLFIIGTGVCITSVSPIIYGNIVDLMIAKKFSEFVKLLIIYLAMLLMISVLSNVEDYFIQILSSRIYRKNQQKLFQEILIKKVSDLEKIELGRLMSNLSGDLSVIIQYSIEFFTTIIYILFNSIIPLYFMFSINVNMALITIIFAPTSIVIFYFFKNKKQVIQKHLNNIEDNHGSYTVNSILNISAIKAYKIEDKISKQYNDITNDLKRTEKENSKINTKVELLNNLTSTFFQITLLIVVSILIMKDEITMGIFISFGMYAEKLFLSINMIQKLQIKEQPVIISLDRLYDLYDILPEDYEKSKKDKKIECISKININNLSFSYDNAEEILSSLTMSIDGAGFYSIVGKNGSGKSTLFKLLMNFYEFSKGSIYLNNINYNELNVLDIRECITYVQKVPFVMTDTLFENINLYGNMSKGEILKICNCVGLSSLIEELQNGLETKISEKTLSSGQLQKLSFARALAHPADVYLFDEITSDLDGVSETQLVEIMRNLGKTKIVISVSHRINAIFFSEKIFLMKNGKIAAQGSFTQLQKNCKEFSSMFTNL